LTPKGWVGLGSLAEGSGVFKARGFDGQSLRNQNVKHVESRIDEAFSSWSHSRVIVRKGGGSADFHGDGSADDVHVVNSNDSLQNRLKTESLEMPKNLCFTTTDLAQGHGFSDGRKGVTSSGINDPHGSVSGGNLSDSLDSSHSTPLDTLGFAPSTRLKSDTFKTANDSGSGDAKSPADLGNGEHLLEVHIDNVVSVDVDPEFAGHVYNLHTLDGYYIADGVVVHNCRCTWIMLPSDQMEEMDADKEANQTPYEIANGVQP
jgi:hypothetical protein